MKMFIFMILGFTSISAFAANDISAYVCDLTITQDEGFPVHRAMVRDENKADHMSATFEGSVFTVALQSNESVTRANISFVNEAKNIKVNSSTRFTLDDNQIVGPTYEVDEIGFGIFCYINTPPPLPESW